MHGYFIDVWYISHCITVWNMCINIVCYVFWKMITKRDKMNNFINEYISNLSVCILFVAYIMLVCHLPSKLLFEFVLPKDMQQQSELWTHFFLMMSALIICKSLSFKNFESKASIPLNYIFSCLWRIDLKWK